MPDGRLRLTAVAAMGMTLAVLASGCASTATPRSGSSGSPTSGGRSGYGYGVGGSPTPTATQSGGPGPVAMTVSQINYKFTPSTFTVKSGATIAVKDANPTTPHTFTIQGKGIDVTNNPGESHDVKIDLPPGTYSFVCRFHAAMGMKGKLTVT
jgi:plastocyanin